MLPRCEERQVPPGRCRRVAIVFAAACNQCQFYETVTAPGAGGTSKPLRQRGWRMRYGKWVCPECCGTKPTTTLRITGAPHA